MNFLEPLLETYIDKHTGEEPALLAELARETHAKVLQPRMLSGHLQGNLLITISKMIRPNAILEIGTYTGYSGICLAQGLSESGILHTIDINDELEKTVRGYIDESGLKDKIRFYVGNALNIIPTITSKFDIVFIDADKENYSKYFDLVFDKVNQGGYIIADNVLWSGKVLDLNKNKDVDTVEIDKFNKKIQADQRVEKMLLPVRDGLMIIRKK